MNWVSYSDDGKAASLIPGARNASGAQLHVPATTILLLILLFFLSFLSPHVGSAGRASFPREPFSNPKGSDQMTSLSFYGVPIYLAESFLSLAGSVFLLLFMLENSQMPPSI
jgi:hypothetical protein